MRRAKKGVIGRLLTDDERWALVEFLKSIPDQAGRVTPFGGPANAALASQDPAFYKTIILGEPALAPDGAARMA